MCMALDKAVLEEWKRLAKSWANTDRHAAAEVVSSIIAEAEWLEALSGMLNELANANADLVRRRDEMLEQQGAELRRARAEVARLRQLVSAAAPLTWLATHDLAAAQNWEALAAEAVK